MSPDEVLRNRIGTHARVFPRCQGRTRGGPERTLRRRDVSRCGAEGLAPSSQIRSAWLRPSASLQSSVAKFGWPSILHSPSRCGATKPHTTRRIVMSNKQHVFEQLGRNARTGHSGLHSTNPPRRPTWRSRSMPRCRGRLVARRDQECRVLAHQCKPHREVVVMMQHTPARPGERITRDGLPWPRLWRGHQTPLRLEEQHAIQTIEKFSGNSVGMRTAARSRPPTTERTGRTWRRDSRRPYRGRAFMPRHPPGGVRRPAQRERHPKHQAGLWPRATRPPSPRRGAMSDYLKRIFGQLVAGLLGLTRADGRGFRRLCVSCSTSPRPSLRRWPPRGRRASPSSARYLRAELNDTLSDVPQTPSRSHRSTAAAITTLSPCPAPIPPRTSRQGREVLSPAGAAVAGEERGEAGRRATAAAAGGPAVRPDRSTGTSPLTWSEPTMGRKRLSPGHDDDPPGLEHLPQLGASARRSSTSGRHRYRMPPRHGGGSAPSHGSY